MMQFLKWILFGNTTKQQKDLDHELIKCNVRIDLLEEQNQNMAEHIDELATCVSEVASAVHFLAQDVNSMVLLINRASKSELADPFQLFLDNDDDDGYLH